MNLNWSLTCFSQITFVKFLAMMMMGFLLLMRFLVIRMFVFLSLLIKFSLSLFDLFLLLLLLCFSSFNITVILFLLAKLVNIKWFFFQWSVILFSQPFWIFSSLSCFSLFISFLFFTITSKRKLGFATFSELKQI